MANLARVRAVWAGTSVVGGGVSTFYFDESHSGFVSDIGGMFSTLSTRIPSSVTITIENTGDLIDVETGALTGTWTDGSNVSVSCTGQTSYAAGVGTRIRWSTDGFSNKRRVRGSTFLVPLSSNLYDTDGTLIAAGLTSITNAAAGLLSNSIGVMKIYTRPVAGAGGKASTVTGVIVPDRVSWLRTRRT